MFLPKDTADHIIEDFCGAMEELRIGNPTDPSDDVGPVITGLALALFQNYIANQSPNMSVEKLVELPAEFI